METGRPRGDRAASPSIPQRQNHRAERHASTMPPKFPRHTSAGCEITVEDTTNLMPEINEFTEVVRGHHSSLRYFIRSLGVRSAWVDDLAQEAFLLAYRKWDELDNPANAGAWLRTIARNLVMNEITKSNRRQRLLDENLTTLLIAAEPPEDTPGAAGDQAVREKALGECLGRLTERSRGVVLARYFDDRNSSEIGEALKMPAATVRKILYHARQTLAECLRGKAIHDPY